MPPDTQLSRRRVLAALSVSIPVATAGCSGFGEEDQTESSSASEQTPTTEPTLSVPGVTDSDVDADVLYATHDSRVRSGSATIEHVVVANNQRTTRHIKVFGGRTQITRRASRTLQSVTYSNTDGAYAAIHSGGSVSYRAVSSPAFDMAARLPLVRGVLSAGDFKPAGVVTREGVEYARLHAGELDGPARLEQYLGYSVIKEVNATAIVTEDGTIRELSFTVTGLRGGTTVTERHRLRYKKIGETTLVEPDWVTEASESTVDMSVKYSSDANLLFLYHEGGRDIPGGSTFTINSPTGKSYTVTTPESISKGDVAYISFTGATAHISVGDPPSERGGGLTGTYVITGETPGGEHLFSAAASR